MTPQNFIRGYIQTHEGGLSLDRADTGNWHHGQLVGSKFGVTGDVLAAYRKVPQVTAAQMAALTLDEAVAIGVAKFYQQPGIVKLPWDLCIASLLDMAWGAGPDQAIKLFQRMIGTDDDGNIGDGTVRAYRAYLARNGIEATARAFGDVRNAFYDLIIAKRPANAKYRNGWRNRTASFLPGTPWWKSWSAVP